MMRFKYLTWRLALLSIAIGLAACGAPELSTADMLTQTRRSMVMVRAEYRGALTLPPIEQAAPQELQTLDAATLGHGTGIFLNDGYIITTAQVVEGANGRMVNVYSDAGDTYPARVIGVSACDNLALLRIDPAAALTPARLGATQAAQTGNTATVIGYGLAMAPDDSPRALQTTITDAGEAGAPLNLELMLDTNDTSGLLLNRSGDIIGMVMTRQDATSRAARIERVREVVEQLKQGNGNTRLGMRLWEVAPGIAPTSAYYGAAGADGGLLVQAVGADGAAIIGVRPGDLIIRLDGRPVTTIADLCAIIAVQAAETRLPVEVLRRGGTEVQLLQGTMQIPMPLDLPIPLDVVPTAPGDASAPITEAEAPPPTGTVTESATLETSLPAPPTGPVTALPALDPTELQNARAAFAALRAPYNQSLFDTFDNEGTKSRWTPVNDVAFSRQLVYSYYELRLNQPNLTTADIWRDPALGNDYIIELAVALNPSGAGRTAAGVIYDAQPDGNSFSAFLIGSDGTWETITFQNQAVMPERFARGQTNAIVGGQGTNILRVVRLAHETQLWVNDTPIATLTPGPFAGGALGVMVTADSAAGAPSGAIVDNLLVLTKGS